MSHSYRKTPKISNTSKQSEKFDKQKASRALRKKVKEQIDNYDFDEELILAEIEEVSNNATFSKDGKSYFDVEEHPKLMRK